MSQSSGRQVAAPRGVGAELHALREELHARQVRAYDRELVLLSELSRMREAWKAAVAVRPPLPLLVEEGRIVIEHRVVPDDDCRACGQDWADCTCVTRGFQVPDAVDTDADTRAMEREQLRAVLEPHRETLAALAESEVAKLHGLGAKGAIR